MSIQSRRNSLFKSSISIRSINDAVISFSEGIKSARKNADEIIKTTRQKNIFKSRLIRNDNAFFRKRQENIRRKDREDELEASSIQGVPKTQGTILAKSTRGFLGRMLDFIGILILGWAVTNLPKIISGIQGLIKKISSVTGILGFFIDSIKNIVFGIGSVLQETLSSLLRFDFLKDKKDIESGLEQAQGGLSSAQQSLVLAATEFAEDPQASDNLGLENPPGLDVDAEEETDKKKSDETEADLEEPAEITAQKKEIEDTTNKITDSTKEADEDEDVVEGDSDDIEGVRNDLESAFEADSASGSVEGGDSSAVSGGGGGTEEPRNLIKQKEKELTKKVEKKYTTTTVATTPFLETPDNVESISQSVTPASNTMLAPVEQYEPDFQSGSRKVNLSSLVTPSKKEVNVQTKRKSGTKVIIVDKPMNVSKPSASSPMGSSPSFDVSQQVNDEKMLMKMQSTSTLKYT